MLSCTRQNASQRTKIISLHPAITETIYALNAQEELLGRSTYCTTPKTVQRLPEYGTSLTPNFEAIAKDQPRIVLTGQSQGIPIKQLKKVATVEQLPWLTLSEVVQSITHLGTIVHRETEAQALAQKFTERFQSRASSGSKQILVLMDGSEITKGQLWFIRSDSIHGAAIEAAGYRNAAPSRFNGPPSMSVERLLQQDPDMILLLHNGQMSPQSKDQWIQSFDALSSLSAVKNKRIAVIEGENIMGVGPGILTLVEQIRETGQALLKAE